MRTVKLGFCVFSIGKAFLFIGQENCRKPKPAYTRPINKFTAEATEKIKIKNKIKKDLAGNVLTL
jgi:hypothetical protein